jgi:hypothetical protein
MEEMGRVKENLKKLDAEAGKAEAIIRALKKLEEELANEAPRKGCLKRKKKPRKAEIDVDNIVSAERAEKIAWHLTDSEKDSPESPSRKMLKIKVKRVKEDEGASSTKSIAVGDKVKILTKRFGTAYEKDRKKFTKGIVKGILGNVCEVLWDGDAETMKSHITHLDKLIKEASPAMPVTTLMLQERNFHLNRGN